MRWSNKTFLGMRASCRLRCERDARTPRFVSPKCEQLPPFKPFATRLKYGIIMFKNKTMSIT